MKPTQGAGRAGHSPPPDTATDVEVRILALTAEGFSVPEVAESLDLPTAEVRRSLQDVCARIGASTEVQAVVWAVKAGLI